jgi:outer membrane receptor protein involved in Fe transport
MKRTWLLLAMAFIMQGVSAQTGPGKIKGKVMDQQQKAIDGASIALHRFNDSVIERLSVAKKDGYFEFDQVPEGRYFLQITALGYTAFKSKMISISVERSVLELDAVELIVSSVMMNEVTVTGRKQLIEMKNDRTVVNVDAAVTNVGATALEVLEKSPGVIVDRDGNISLKGKPGVLILVDGKQTYLSGADLTTMLSSMSANQLDQIEIMTNPSSKYDAAGNSGVINIKTKKNRQRGFNGNTSLSYGQGKYWKTNNSVNLNYRNEKLNYFLNYSLNANAGYSQLDILRTYFAPDGKTVTAYFRQPSQMISDGKNNTLKLGLDYNLSKTTTVGFVASGFLSPRIFNSNSTGYLQDASAITDSFANTIGRNKDRWKNGSININFRQQLKANAEITADVDYIKYRSDNTQSFDNSIYYPDGSLVSTDQLRGVLPSDISIYSFKTDYARTFKKGLKLEAGLKSSLVKTDNEAIYTVKEGDDWIVDYNKTNHFLYEENINAAYLNASTQLKKWTLQAGLRFENTNYKGNQLGNPQKQDSSFDRTYNSLFPTVFISYAADSNNTFTINTGRRIDRPAYRELNPFLFFINKYTYAAGNPFLLPQFTYNIELSHSFKGMINTGLSYSITNDYATQVFRPEGEVTILTEGNIGRAENYGFSIGTQLKFWKWWSFSANANINYRKVDGSAFGREIKTAAMNGQLNINNQFTFEKGWSAELSGFYNSKSVEGQFEIQPFSQVSIGVGKQVLKGKGSIKFNVRDIFFSQIIDGQILYGNVKEHFIQSRDSRVANIAFTYRFGKTFKDAPARKKGGASEEQNRVGN